MLRKSLMTMLFATTLGLLHWTPTFAAVPGQETSAPTVENITSKDQMHTLLRSDNEMLLVVAVGPNCASCRQLPDLLAQQARKHPGVKIVTADAAAFGIPADKLPVAAMFEPKTSFLLDFTSATAPAYLDANVNLTPANIDTWMNEREHNARVELWDEHRYQRLLTATFKMQQTGLDLFQRGDSYSMRIKRARLDDRIADCFAEMFALQARFYHARDLDQKWKPQVQNN